MKRLMIAVVSVLLIAGVAFAKDFEVKKKAGDLNVTITMDKNPPAAGKNNITIAVKDAAGKDVADAKVAVDYSMPAMPGMPAMNYKANATLNGSAYKAVMDLSMSGSWNVAVKINKGGKSSVVKFNVDAQ